MPLNVTYFRKCQRDYTEDEIELKRDKMYLEMIVLKMASLLLFHSFVCHGVSMNEMAVTNCLFPVNIRGDLEGP